MKTIIFLGLACMAMGGLNASQKYNPYTNKFETVPPNSQIKYNPYNNNYSFQPPGAKLEYNPYSRKYEWNSGHNP